MTVTQPQSQTLDMEVSELPHEVWVPQYTLGEAVENVVSEQVGECSFNLASLSGVNLP